MKSNCPPKIVLEGFFFGGQLTEEVEDHVGSCPDCQAKLERWSSEKETFLRRYSFDRFWDARRPKRIWERYFLSTPLRATVVFGTLAGLMFFTVWTSRRPADLSVKGGVALSFYVAEGESLEAGKDRMALPEGSEIQFVYSVKREKYLLFMGFEADRTFTVYFPEGGEQSGSIVTGEKLRFPHALRWQPSTAYERFFAFFSDKPIPVDQVVSTLRREAERGKSVEELKNLPLPYPQASVLLYRK